MRDAQIEDAYDEIVEFLGEAPDSRIWELAIRCKNVAEYTDGEITVEDLASALEDISDFLREDAEVRAEERNSKQTESADNYRRSAINQIFAVEATELDVVMGFRAEWLPEGLLEMDDVDAWIMKRKALEGPPSTWITVLADENDQPDIEDSIQSGHTASSRLVRFVVPDRAWIRSEAVNAVGALIELATVADTLVRRYDWSEAWAATFVLTGTVPPPILARWSENEPWPWLNARRSVTITVRLDVSPKQLMEMYRAKRQHMLRSKPLPRAISERKAKLAVFAARNHQGHTWGETMRLWNRENPEHQIASESQFSRDSHDAYNRIMGESLNWIGTTAPEESKHGTR